MLDHISESFKVRNWGCISVMEHLPEYADPELALQQQATEREKEVGEREERE